MEGGMGMRGEIEVQGGFRMADRSICWGGPVLVRKLHRGTFEKMESTAQKETKNFWERKVDCLEERETYKGARGAEQLTGTGRNEG